VICVAAEKFGGRGRRTGAGVEEHYAHFALGKILENYRQVADYHGQKAEAYACFGYGDESGGGSSRDGVFEAEGEEICAADVERVGEVNRGFESFCWRSGGDKQEREADDHAGGPEDEQKKQGHGAEVAEERFARFVGFEPAAERAIGDPTHAIENTSEPKAAGDAARQNYGLEGFEEDREENRQSDDGQEDVHSVSSFADIVISALSTRETGQLALAEAAAPAKASAEAPGIRAATSRWTLVMVHPASSFSKVRVAAVAIFSAVRWSVISWAERAIEKQPACAAAINSSGFVPGAFSKRVVKE